MPMIEKTFDSCVGVQETKKRTYEQSYGSGPTSWGSCLLLMPSSSHPGVGVSLLSENCLKVSWRSAVLSMDQSGTGALFRWEI